MKAPKLLLAALTHTLAIALVAETIPYAAPVAWADDANATPLCANGGYGAEIQTWPPLGKDSQSYNQRLQSFIQKNHQKILEGQAGQIYEKMNTQGHAPDLSPSVKAREDFFQAAFQFGSPSSNEKQKHGSIVVICEARRSLAANYAAYMQKKNSMHTDETGGVCSASMQSAKDSYDKASQGYDHLSTLINEHLQSLAQAYVRDRAQNKQNLEAIKDRAAFYSPLQQNLLDTWGAIDPSQKPAGAFATVIMQVRHELDNARKDAAQFKTTEAETGQQLANCGSNNTGKAAGTTPKTTEQLKKDQGPGSQVTKFPGKEKDDLYQAPADSTEKVAQKPAADGSNPAGTENTGNIDNLDNPDTQKAAEQTQTTEPPAPTDGQNPPQDKLLGPANEGSGVTGFLKRNWAWLAAGTAAVGVGVYAIHENKKKKDEINDLKNQLKTATSTATATTTTTSTSTSTSTSTTVTGTIPSGAKILLLTGVTAPTVGVTLPPISLALADANGNPLTGVSGVAIEASCLTPNPCSLTGAKSVTVVNGTVNFTGLSFSQADQGVVLQFSATGFPSITAPSFNVGTSDSSRQ